MPALAPTINAIRHQPQAAAAILQARENAPKREKKERLSKRVRSAINLLITGECRTQRAAAQRVGMHEVSLCAALKKPAARVFVAQRVRENIASGAMRAGARLMELVDADSEHVSFDASKFVLGVEGIKPQSDAQVSVNIDIKAGYVIDLSGRRPTYRDSISHTDPNEIKDITPDSVHEP